MEYITVTKEEATADGVLKDGYEKWAYVYKKVIPDTEEEAAIGQQAKATVAIQNLLDTTARQKDYDDIFTLISYVGDPDPIFDAEGQAAKSWRSEVWTTARQIKADVIAGTRPMPTVEEGLSEMPVFVWPE